MTLTQLPSRKFQTLTPREPSSTFEDLLLAPALKENFYRLKREHDRRALLARNGLTPRNRLLFYGPPGNGKTATAEAIAVLFDMPLYLADYSQMINSYVGDSEKAVVGMFEDINKAKCVVLFDEADSLLSSRFTPRSSADQARNNSTNIVLTRLDALKPDVIFIAATNRDFDLDRAAARRFDLRIEFPAPNREEQEEFCRRVLKRFPVLKRKYSPAKVLDALPDSSISFAELEKEIIDLARLEIVGR